MRSKIWAAGSALLLVAGLITVGASPALADPPVDKVCDNLDTGHKKSEGVTSLTIEAPAGQLIDRYCVKAGSANQKEEKGGGPEYTTLNPPVQSILISHSTDKDISHWSASYVNIPQDAAAAVSTTPATCTTGETLVLGAVTYAAWGTPTGTTGPGQYEVTATASTNHLFPNGKSTLTFTGTLSGPLTGATCEEDEPEAITPAPPTFSSATCLAQLDLDNMLTVPADTDRVYYTWSGKAVPGRTVTVKAFSQDESQWTLDGITVWTHKYPITLLLPCIVTPVAPSVVAIDGCGTTGSVTIVPTPGVKYTNWTPDVTSGEYKVTATPQFGYIFPGNSLYKKFEGSLGIYTDCPVVNPAADIWLNCASSDISVHLSNLGDDVNEAGEFDVYVNDVFNRAVTVAAGSNAYFGLKNLTHGQDYTVRVMNGDDKVFEEVMTYDCPVTVPAANVWLNCDNSSIAVHLSNLGDDVNEAVELDVHVNGEFNRTVTVGAGGETWFELFNLTFGAEYQITVFDGDTTVLDETLVYDCAVAVVPVAPSVTDQTCISGDFVAGSITVTLDDNIQYRIEGEGVDFIASQATTVVDPGTYTVTATAGAGYVLDGEAVSTVEVAAAEACGDLVTHPLVTPLASMKNLGCDTGGSYTLNDIEGVLWFVDGEPATAGTYSVNTPGAVNVTAQADGPEYGLEFDAQTRWSFTYTAAEDCGDLVTHPLVSPLASMKNLGCDTGGSYSLNNIEGVLWFVDGEPATAGTYSVNAPGTVNVTAQAAGPDYGLEFEAQTAWTFKFTAAEACGDLTTLPFDDLETLALTGAQNTNGWLISGGLLVLFGGAFLALTRRKGSSVE